MAWYGITKMNNVKCKHCGSDKVIKNGRQRRIKGGRWYRQQLYFCKQCGRQQLGAKRYEKR